MLMHILILINIYSFVPGSNLLKISGTARIRIDSPLTNHTQKMANIGAKQPKLCNAFLYAAMVSLLLISKL